ncbi:hypothetical protein [Planococcus lenghuensis]|uniref:hypothetical protein n=1 Tax=Planococcus lenghuensis TaxID=2213202 RepID=UPI001E63A724|nr:hypothetical protein [Planococcus lenghuensis]
MHAAVIALDENGYRYLCDLGDQWVSPILVDNTSETFTPEPLSGFYPAARVAVTAAGQHVEIQYHQPAGKWRSFLSTNEGLFPDPDTVSLEEWAVRISQYAGFNEEFTLEALMYFGKLKN